MAGLAAPSARARLPWPSYVVSHYAAKLGGTEEQVRANLTSLAAAGELNPALVTWWTVEALLTSRGEVVVSAGQLAALRPVVAHLAEITRHLDELIKDRAIEVRVVEQGGAFTPTRWAIRRGRS